MENQFGRVSEVFIRTKKQDSMTEVEDLYFSATFKVMHAFDRKDGWKEIMIMSVSAGTMAGDRQKYSFEIGAGSKVEVTSQAYEKIHGMDSGFASRETEIHVEENAILYFRPQPVIPFAGSDFRSHTRIRLQKPDSRLIMSDILCSGRTAMGEKFSYRRYDNYVEIYKGMEEKILSYRDNTRYEPNQKGENSSLTGNMSGFGLYEGYEFLLNLLFCNISLEKEQEQKIRKVLENAESERITGGFTYTWDGDLVIRALGMSAEKLEKLSEQLVKIMVIRDVM